MQRAEAAHLIVVNHALLLSDVSLEGRLLPEFRHLIVDEAHHLEARATDSLGFTVDQRQADFLLNGLSVRLGNDRRAADTRLCRNGYGHDQGGEGKQFQSVLHVACSSTKTIVNRRLSNYVIRSR
jgi:Rad3-related DNA helicase